MNMETLLASQVMRKLFFSLLAGATLISSSAKAAPAAIDLFNGVNLSNWKAVLAKPEVPMEDVFSVVNGMIICKGEPLGYIETDRRFTNFKLEVEWRWAPGKPAGNSGVFLRINGVPRPLPRCIECQLKSGDAGDVYGFHGMKIDGDPARRVVKRGHELGGDFVGIKKMFGNENTPGKWNRYEIEINGYDLKVTVNGRLVNRAKRCEFVTGPIGLQSEGGEVQFRKVRLTPLP
jgi:hypothetical protein